MSSAKLAAVLLLLFISPAYAGHDITPDNPVVPIGHINPEFTHGSYPSPDVGDGEGEGDWTHVGVDIGADCGSDVYAFADGEVLEVIKESADLRYAKGLGFAVVIKHPAEQNTWNQKPFYTLYLHLDEPPLKDVGDPVVGRQTVVGKVGNKGTKAEGTDENCHTHFEVRHFQGIEGFWHPQWGEQTESGMRLNIYGRGNQSDSPLLTTDWKDPEFLFREHRQEITKSMPQKDAPVHDCDRLAADPEDPNRVTDPERYLYIDSQEYIERSFQACKEAVATFPDVARFEYQLWRSYKRLFPGNFENSRALLRRAADYGYVAAEYWMGLHYYFDYSGSFEEGDAIESAEWFHKAAAQGYAHAQTMLGIAYEHGKGVSEDRDKALEWYHKAAAQKDLFAYQRLAEVYDPFAPFDDGSEGDYQEAMKWYQKLINREFVTNIDPENIDIIVSFAGKQLENLQVKIQQQKVDLEKKQAELEEAKRQKDAEEKRLQEAQRKRDEVCLPENPKGDTRWLVQEHTEAAAKEILSNSIFCQSDDLIKFLRFDKTDGQSREEFGVKFYKLMYEAEIEFLRNVWWSGDKRFGSNFDAYERTAANSQDFLAKMNNYPKNAGERQNISGVILFEKTERGWWGAPGRIKLTR